MSNGNENLVCKICFTELQDVNTGEVATFVKDLGADLYTSHLNFMADFGT